MIQAEEESRQTKNAELPNNLEKLFIKSNCNDCGLLLLSSEKETHQFTCPGTFEEEKIETEKQDRHLVSPQNPCNVCGLTSPHSEAVCGLTILQNFQKKCFRIVKRLKQSISLLGQKIRTHNEHRILICAVCRNFGCEGTLERCSVCKAYICQACKKFSTKTCNQCKQVSCVLCFYVSAQKDHFDSFRSTKVELRSKMLKKCPSEVIQLGDFLCPSQIKKFETQGSCLQELQSITEENEEDAPVQTPTKTTSNKQLSLNKLHSRFSSAKKLTGSNFFSDFSSKKSRRKKNQMDSGFNFFIGIRNHKMLATSNETRDHSKNAIQEYSKFHHQNDTNPNCEYKLGSKTLDPIVLQKTSEPETVSISSQSASKLHLMPRGEEEERVLEFKNEHADLRHSMNYSIPYKEMIEGVECEESETGIKGNKHYFNKIDITENMEDKAQSSHLLSKNFCFICNTKNKNKKQKKMNMKKTPILIGELSKILSKMKTTFN